MKNRTVIGIMLIIISIVLFIMFLDLYPGSIIFFVLPLLTLLIVGILILKTNISLLQLFSVLFPILSVTPHLFFLILGGLLSVLYHSPLIILPSLVSIFLTILPVNEYKNISFRRAGLFVCGIMLLVFGYSIWQLFNLPPRGGWDINGLTVRDLVVLAAQIGIMATFHSFIFIPLKIRKALKELKIENKSY